MLGVIAPKRIAPEIIRLDHQCRLESLFGQLEEQNVPVCRAIDGYFGYDANGDELFQSAVMHKDKAVEFFKSEPSDGCSYSVRNRRLHCFEYAETKLNDYNFSNSRYSMRLWAAIGRSQTPLHYDASNNVIVSLAGDKELHFFSPDKFDRLYPYENSFKRGHVSRADYREPCRDRFPLFPDEADLTISIGEGEAVLIPAFWWHYVESSDYSVAVNFWWDCELNQLVHRHALTALTRSEPGDLFLQSVKPSFDELMQSAHLARSFDNRVGALVLLLTALEFSLQEDVGVPRPSIPDGERSFVEELKNDYLIGQSRIGWIDARLHLLR